METNVQLGADKEKGKTIREAALRDGARTEQVVRERWR